MNSQSAVLCLFGVVAVYGRKTLDNSSITQRNYDRPYYLLSYNQHGHNKNISIAELPIWYSSMPWVDAPKDMQK